MAVLFNSSRPLGRCENLTAVWEAYGGPKRFNQAGYADMSYFGDCDVVVTDEFIRRKRKDQKVVMIAHGLTGGKLYGRDQKQGVFAKDPDSCSLVDYYVVSSEYGRKFASSASGIPIERCIPLGMPRTDAYIGKKKGDGGTFLAKFGKAYLYVPTFRAFYDKPTPRIDWALVDSLLDDDEVLVVKRHIHQGSLLKGAAYPHIVEVGNMEPSTGYLIDCDVVVTDFSSILFDGYVLNKPSVLTATADDPYLETRGMYMEYPYEYGSRALAVEGNEHAFVEELHLASSIGMHSVECECREKVAGACDGRSTERVVKLVRSLL